MYGLGDYPDAVLQGAVEALDNGDPDECEALLSHLIDELELDEGEVADAFVECCHDHGITGVDVGAGTITRS